MDHTCRCQGVPLRHGQRAPALPSAVDDECSTSDRRSRATRRAAGTGTPGSAWRCGSPRGHVRLVRGPDEGPQLDRLPGDVAVVINDRRLSFCALWGAVFPDNLVVIYRELYQADLTPEQQAKLVTASERPSERLPGRPIPVALDPSCWQRPATTVTKPIEPDAPAEGSIAWWYRRELGGAVRKAHNDRVGGWALVDQHLRPRGDGLPRLY